MLYTSHLLSARARFVDLRKRTSTHSDTRFIVACSVLACIVLFYWSSLCLFVTRAQPVQLHRYTAFTMLSASLLTINRISCPVHHRFIRRTVDNNRFSWLLT
jgi:hypothetical protein